MRNIFITRPEFFKRVLLSPRAQYLKEYDRCRANKEFAEQEFIVEREFENGRVYKCIS